PVRVHVWGACGRWFESSHPDELLQAPTHVTMTRVGAFLLLRIEIHKDRNQGRLLDESMCLP
ncbi:MAG: hypothetical protein Q4A53_02075, partial [Porphyromonas sp.]|nr:hypothetical protein [Porphyromonas sp.]